jgi:Leucine-rich repeat (LRR) protein
MGLKDQIGKILSECIPSMPTIKSLILVDNNLTDTSLVPLLNNLIELSSLEELDLSFNKIGIYHICCII